MAKSSDNMFTRKLFHGLFFFFLMKLRLLVLVGISFPSFENSYSDDADVENRRY